MFTFTRSAHAAAVGLALLLASSATVFKSFSAQTSMVTIFRGVIPLFGIEIVRVLLLFAVPAICLILPA